MSSPAPATVSPLIKFSRWALLSAGIVYGMGKYAALSVVESKRREKRLALLHEMELIARKKNEMQQEEQQEDHTCSAMV